MNATERRHFELQQVRKDRAFNWLVIWFCLFVVLLMAVLHTSTLNWRFNRESYSVMNDRALWATIIGLAFCGICGAVCVYRIMDADEKQFMVVEDDNGQDDDEPSDGSGRSNFGQEHNPGTVRIESVKNQTITLGSANLRPKQWRAIVTALSNNNWYWSRPILQTVNMPIIEGTDHAKFTGLTTKLESGDTKMTVLTDEMIELEMVEQINARDKRVTEKGRTELCRVANLGIVI